MHPVVAGRSHGARVEDARRFWLLPLRRRPLGRLLAGGKGRISGCGGEAAGSLGVGASVVRMQAMRKWGRPLYTAECSGGVSPTPTRNGLNSTRFRIHRPRIRFGASHGRVVQAKLIDRLNSTTTIDRLNSTRFPNPQDLSSPKKNGASRGRVQAKLIDTGSV